MKTLNDLNKGQSAEIIDFVDNSSKSASVRFGLGVGQIIKCKTKFGPMVITKNQQNIAVGHNLCKKIFIKEI